MTTETFNPFEGHCTCKSITYEVLAPFLCVNCCHCTWCQRGTGSAFAINAIVETSNFKITSDTQPIIINTSSPSGKGQKIARCPKCYVVLYSHFAGDGPWTAFVRVGTLTSDARKTIRPDVHVFTSTKLDWVDLEDEKRRGIPIMQGYYQRDLVWTKDALQRYDKLKQEIAEAKQTNKSISAGQDKSTL